MELRDVVPELVSVSFVVVVQDGVMHATAKKPATINAAVNRFINPPFPVEAGALRSAISSFLEHPGNFLRSLKLAVIGAGRISAELRIVQ